MFKSSMVFTVHSTLEIHALSNIRWFLSQEKTGAIVKIYGPMLSPWLKFSNLEGVNVQFIENFLGA